MTRAVVASLPRISKSRGEGWAPNTAERATEFWFECVGAGCKISEQVSSPEQYVSVRYEDLRSDPEMYVAGLYGWLGLPFDDELVQTAIQCARSP